jgi:hypothetical protein
MTLLCLEGCGGQAEVRGQSKDMEFKAVEFDLHLPPVFCSLSSENREVEHG